MKTFARFASIMLAVAALAMLTGCAGKKKQPVAAVPSTPVGGSDTVSGTLLTGPSTPLSTFFIPNQAWIDAANWSQMPKIYFDTDSSMIRAGERPKLEQIANYLKANPQQYLLVAGHCDERGTAEYNRALGERRANSAREYLVRLGVNPDRMATISYGKDRPAIRGYNESAWSQNRRCEFGIGPM